MMCPKPTTKKGRHKQTIACDISPQVKAKVWERDGGRCVVCGNSYNVMPNCHYVSRANGGLGIEQNVVVACTELTENKCHRKYDFGTKEEREEIAVKIKAHLMGVYPNWNEEELIYSKYDI